MALTPVVDSLDNVEPALQNFYVELDGKFRLDIDGGFKTHDEINGLTSALNKERDNRSKLEKTLKKFEGIENPEEAFKAMETVRNLDAKKLIDAGEVEKVKAEVSKAMQSQIDALQRHAEELKLAVKEKENILHQELLGGRFARSKFIAERLTIPPDMVQFRFGSHFQIQNGQVTAVDGQGNEIYSNNRPGEIADFDEALEKIINNYPHKDTILKGSGATGAGVQNTGTSQRRGDWRTLPPEERMAINRTQLRR